MTRRQRRRLDKRQQPGQRLASRSASRGERSDSATAPIPITAARTSRQRQVRRRFLLWSWSANSSTPAKAMNSEGSSSIVALPTGDRGNDRKVLQLPNRNLEEGNGGVPQPKSSDRTGKAAPTRRPERSTRTRPRRVVSPFVYLLRLLILGVGLSVIVGTMLAVWLPSTRSSTADGAASHKGKPGQLIGKPPTPVKLGQELAPLKTQIQALAARTPDLNPGVFLMDLDNGNYVDLNGTAAFPSASMIKVPILVAFFQDLDAGKVTLDEKLVMRPEWIATGSGGMQYQPPNSQFTALETATQMIIDSDNTATNMIIARLGGIAALNQRFASWGLTSTAMQNLLPDLEGTNVTTPQDMTNLMHWISQGELVSLRSRDRMLDIMRRTLTDTLLPQGLEPGATISHKTGDIRALVGDVGLIDTPNGKRYVMAAMVRRPANDSRAQELIRQISQTTYKFLTQPPPVVAAPAANPAASSSPTMRETAPNSNP